MLDRLFDNPGSTIKSYAKGIFWILILLTIMVAIIVAVEEFSLITTVLILLSGAFVSFFEVIFVYAFGDMVENTARIRNKLDDLDNVRNTMPSRYAVANNAGASVAVAPAVNSQDVKNVNKPQSTSASGVRQLSKAEFIKNALEYRLDEGLIHYANKNYSRLNDDDKKELADIVTIIENNDADGLRAKLKEHA